MWASEGGGRQERREKSFGLSAEVDNRNSFGMFSLHGCTGKSTTVRRRERIHRCFFSSGPSTG